MHLDKNKNAASIIETALKYNFLKFSITNDG